MIETLFADLTSGASNRLAEVVIKCLAVGGGFLAGYAGGRLIAWALDRWVFAHKAPDQLKSLCGLLGGIALAILVAMIVFGSGGGGLFGGGSSAGEQKGATGDDKNKQQPIQTPPQDDTKPPPKVEPKVDVKPTPGDVRVAILGGAEVQEGKFYRLDTDPTPRTLDELKKAIADLPKDKGDAVLVFRFAKERLSNTHPEMKRLDAWLKEAKITSRFE